MTVERQVTIREAYVEASSFLQRQNVSEGEGCAELLLEHLLGLSRSELLLSWQELFPVELTAQWRQLLERKAAGEPVQYIIGEQEFYGLPFTVTPAVLIPRPETELLVEQVVRFGKRLWPESGDRAPASAAAASEPRAEQQVPAAEPGSMPKGCGPKSGNDEGRQGNGNSDKTQQEEAGIFRYGTTGAPLVADIGAGSGAIAVSLAVQCPQWRIVSSDISPAALAVAGANAERHGVGERIAFVEGDLLEPYIKRGLRLDAIVSNPPYIPEADEPWLQPEVRLYEPRTALYGGADGLVLYRRLAAQLAELAAMPSLVGLEVGLGQAQEVAQLLAGAADWDEIRIVPDLAGIERHVIAVRWNTSER